MKTSYILILLTVLIFSYQTIYSQRIGDLKGINYQAVAIDEYGKEIVGMDVNGKPLYHKTIGVKFSILKGSAGEVLYQETHEVQTDRYGLFSVVIGLGNTTGQGSYAALMEIPWIDADQFLKVEIATKNDGNYKTVSNQQFMSVPYSYYTDDIADDAITTEKILDFEILNQDISTGAIDSRTILDFTIINEDIATGAVDSRAILDSTIINEDIATGAVDSRAILDYTIVNEDIATGAVDSRAILDSTIINIDIQTGAIDSRAILDSTIVNEDIATGAVDSRAILDYTIVNEDIATSAVDSRAILNGTILNEDIADGTIDTRTILDGSILNEDIADATIDITTKVTGILPVENGGTGVDLTTVANGQLLIGDGTNGNFQLSNITAGTGIEIVNSSGGITISSPPISTETSSDGSFTIPVGSSGVIAAGTAWYSPNNLKVTPPADKPFEMGDIFLASANVNLMGCILSVYLESIDGDGRANVQVILYNPQTTNATLQTPVTFKFLLVK